MAPSIGDLFRTQQTTPGRIISTGLGGQVGKTPDIGRGLAIDIGAVVNVHSKAWVSGYVKSCLEPPMLWLRAFDSSTNTTAVEGKAANTAKAHRMARGIVGPTKSGGRRYLAPTFPSQELKGGDPALLPT